MKSKVTESCLSGNLVVIVNRLSYKPLVWRPNMGKCVSEVQPSAAECGASVQGAVRGAESSGQTTEMLYILKTSVLW